MLRPNYGWLGMKIRSAWAAIVVVLVALGCASPQAPTGAGEAGMVQTIGEVSVTRDGDESVVWLGGLVDPIYSLTETDDENVVVVELIGVGKPAADSLMGAVQDEDQQVAAYDGVVDVVSLSTFDEGDGEPLTRVEIVMASPGDAQVFSTGDGLEIRVGPAEPMAESAPDTLSESWAAAPEETVSQDFDPTAPYGEQDEYDEMAATPEPLEPEAITIADVPAPPEATQLTALSATETADGVLLALEANGGIGALEAFTLEDPTRLVIDLPGLSAAPSVGNVSLGSTLVSGIRVGAHSDKVRVVVDGGADARDFSGRQIMPGTTGLWIAIGGGDALAQALDEALSASEAAWVASAAESLPQPPATADDAGQLEEAFTAVTDSLEAESFEAGSVEEEAPPTPVAGVTDFEETDGFAPMEEPQAVEPGSTTAMEAFELAEVYGLHYERTDGMDRTAILADDAVDYTTSSPDPTTFVVSIRNANISEQASDRIFPKAGGPVSLIHAFQQPEVEVPEVRVVFTRAPSQQPVVSRRGSMLFVDFEDRGVAAAPPPAFPNAGESQVASGAMDAPVAGDAMPSEFGSTAPADEMAAAGMEAMGAMPAATVEVAPVPGAAEPMEVVSDLPGFDTGTTVAALSAPDAGSIWDAPVAAPNAPAAVEVPAAIEVLEEGGLIDGKEYRGRRVSLDFKDVAIADVLRLIAEVSDLNIIAGDEVSGNVTIRLVEVPWDQALDVILMTKGLGFVRVGNVLRIAPSDVLKAEEEVRLQERRNKEKLEDLEVKLLPVNYAAVKDTEGLVKRLLSARGTVNLDERTNTLIIKDISSVIDEASALISAIDTQTPQVMIEAKIVEANLDFSRELGSVWGIQTQQFTDPFDPDTPRRDLGSEDLTFIDSNSLAFANPITSVPTGLLTVGALILDQDFRVDAQIQAAESTGDGKVVSSPRIVTLDNTEAKIEQGVSIPFQTFEGGDAKLEFIDAVLSLIVTPHITADESIIMEIEVTRNAPDSTVPTPTGSPAIAKNVAETETLVKDGQTLVLGGIYTITKSQTQSRIPYLHRIPVIGNAFKSNSVTDSRKELLVFVTPRIVRLPEMASN